MVEHTDHRRRPRRRGEALHSAILDAAIEELAEVGYAELTMERVAERAKASKASLYRRWPGKLELTFDAAARAFPESGQLPDTGSLRGDLMEFMRLSVEAMRGPVGEAMRGLISDALRDYSTVDDLRGHETSRTLILMRELVARAAERGELDLDHVTERQLEAGHAILRFHFLFRGAPLGDDLVQGIVDEVMIPLLTGANTEPR